MQWVMDIAMNEFGFLCYYFEGFAACIKMFQ